MVRSVFVCMLLLAWQLLSPAPTVAAVDSIKRGRVQMALPRRGDVIESEMCGIKDDIDPREFCRYVIKIVNWWSSAATEDEACATLPGNTPRYLIKVLGMDSLTVDCASLNKKVDGLTAEKEMGVMIPKEFVSVLFRWTVEDLLTGETVVDERYPLILADPSNATKSSFNLFQHGLPKCSLSHSSSGSCVLDFIEVGTSNFDTCAQAMRTFRRPDAKWPALRETNSFAGISIEPIWGYLSQLPDDPDLLRVNAALSADINEQPVTVYHMLESTIDKFGGANFRKGCSSVNVIHPEIFYFINRNDLDVDLVQRTKIPTVSVDRLFREVLVQGGYKRPRLLKLDAEGMDYDIVNAMVDFYESANSRGFGSLGADRQPCLVAFETTWGTGHFFVGSEISPPSPDPAISRLKSLGYVMAAELLPNLPSSIKYFSDNELAINCQCSVEDLTIGAMYLQEFDATIPEQVCKLAGNPVREQEIH